MAVPISGPLKLWDNIWNQEIGGTKGNNSLHSGSIYAGFSTPDAMSDFYGWSDVEPPSVTTNGITSVSTGGMVLNGTVTDTGNETPNVGFYFGTNANSSTSNPQLAVGTANAGFSCSKGQLPYNTTHYNWAYACNSAGLCIGGRVQATTNVPAFSPTYANAGVGRTNCLFQYYVNPYTGGWVRYNSSGNDTRDCFPTNTLGIARDYTNPTHSNTGAGGSFQTQTYILAGRGNQYTANFSNNSGGSDGSGGGSANLASGYPISRGNSDSAQFNYYGIHCVQNLSGTPYYAASLSSTGCACYSDIRLKTNINYL
jgi:hypothetical protein